MSLLKSLTIKISSAEEPQSSNEANEKVEEPYYCIKVPFPDEDQYCYVLHECGYFESTLKKFSSRVEAEHYADFHGIKNYSIEKIH